jgi:DNA-binding response OmpR family regulator
MKCLIVDDELLIRKSLARAMRSKDHTAMEAESGTLGLDLWLNNKFDLVFLDLVLPDMSGFEIVKRRGVYSESLILMTAFSDEEERSLREIKPAGFLKKPFSNIFAIVQFAEQLMERKI